MVSGLEEEIRSLMALSPGRKAITHSTESTIVGNGLIEETRDDSSGTIALRRRGNTSNLLVLYNNNKKIHFTNHSSFIDNPVSAHFSSAM